ncbi:MAG: muconolactone Delta-isomerase family protein [Aggregatilineales bacterium]
MKWMATITFKEKPTAEVLAMLLAERARVAEMVTEGIIENRYFAANGAQVWFVLQGDSREAVDRALSTLPMHRFFDMDVQQLS